jgi:hypothetical protein
MCWPSDRELATMSFGLAFAAFLIVLLYLELIR